MGEWRRKRCWVSRRSGSCARLFRLDILMRRRGGLVPSEAMRVSICRRLFIMSGIRNRCFPFAALRASAHTLSMTGLEDRAGELDWRTELEDGTGFGWDH